MAQVHCLIGRDEHTRRWVNALRLSKCTEHEPFREFRCEFLDWTTLAPGYFRDFPEWVKSARSVAGPQLIVVRTGNPYMLDQFEPHEATLCLSDGRLRRLSESRVVCEQVKLFTCGEIWSSDTDEALWAPMEPAKLPPELFA